MRIREATEADRPAIATIVAAAFGREEEARIVEGVRAEGASLLELVAEDEGVIAGHILFSRMRVEPERFVAALGPLAVAPERQNEGVGQALCREGLARLRPIGVEAVVLLGHPTYYPRFGFSAAAAAKLASPYAGHRAFMALELKEGALASPLAVAYPAAFG